MRFCGIFYLAQIGQESLANMKLWICQDLSLLYKNKKKIVKHLPLARFSEILKTIVFYFEFLCFSLTFSKKQDILYHATT